MTYATTFSGIGGWEIGLNACGWKLKWQCESDWRLCAHLDAVFGVPVYPDIRELKKYNPRKVDVLAASPPCQPFSICGSRSPAGDVRDLFGEIVNAIRFLEPKWVLVEQVAEILFSYEGRIFGEYAAGLASLGYDLIWHCIRASDVGAPHKRDRIWIIALSRSQRRERLLCGKPSISGAPATIWPTAPLDSQCATLQILEERLGESSIFGSYDGLSTELALASYGNALTPQIPYLIGQAINSVESPAVEGRG
jgi:DNA (cytosine-5)-methyltransferase 1